MALWDLAARLEDVPLHRRLGSIWDDVPIYGSGGFTTYDEHRLTDQLTDWTVRQAIPRVKIKIGQSWGLDERRDRDRIRQARAIIGDDVALFVDANGAYTAKQAVRLLHDVADAGVTWFEEPVSSDDLEGLAEVRHLVVADVAAGEYGTDEPYFRRMCEAGAIDCLQADATRCGGYTIWQRAVRSRTASVSRSRATAPRTCTPISPEAHRTSGTSSGSTTTSESNRCASTAHSTRRAALSRRGTMRRGTASQSRSPTSSDFGSPDSRSAFVREAEPRRTPVNGRR